MLRIENSATLQINLNTEATTMEVSKVGRTWTVETREDVLVVEWGKMHMTNILPRMPLAIIACKQKGHYSGLCYAKTVAAVSTEGTGNIDIDLLDSASTNKEAAWLADVQISTQETLKFKLDMHWH